MCGSENFFLVELVERKLAFPSENHLSEKLPKASGSMRVFGNITRSLNNQKLFMFTLEWIQPFSLLMSSDR